MDSEELNELIEHSYQARRDPAERRLDLAEKRGKKKLEKLQEQYGGEIEFVFPDGTTQLVEVN